MSGLALYLAGETNGPGGTNFTPEEDRGPDETDPVAVGRGHSLDHPHDNHGARDGVGDLVTALESVQGTDLIVIPHTGEAVDLTADDAVLAEAFDAIKQHEAHAKELRETIGDELRRRMDKRVRYTLHTGRFTVTAPSKRPVTEYDCEELWTRLTAFVCDGLIDAEARDAAVERETNYKAKVAGINALKTLGGVVAEAIDACSEESERTSRPVTVKIAKEARA